MKNRLLRGYSERSTTNTAEQCHAGFRNCDREIRSGRYTTLKSRPVILREAAAAGVADRAPSLGSGFRLRVLTPAMRLNFAGHPPPTQDDILCECLPVPTNRP